MTPAERMRVYRRRKHAAGYKVVSKWQPMAADSPAVYSDHIILDARSLALHCKIAGKIDRTELSRTEQTRIRTAIDADFQQAEK